MSRPSGMTLLIITVALFFAGAIGWQWWSTRPAAPSGTASSAPPPPPPRPDAKALHTIHGTMTLIDTKIEAEGGFGCRGSGGFSDIAAGKQVTVTDATSKVIGVGTFGPGQPGRDVPNVVCVFEFSIPNLPGVEFYGIEAQRRGTLHYSLEEMKRRDWTIRDAFQGTAGEAGPHPGSAREASQGQPGLSLAPRDGASRPAAEPVAETRQGPRRAGDATAGVSRVECPLRAHGPRRPRSSNGWEGASMRCHCLGLIAGWIVLLMVNAGVAERVAMTVTGHKTRAVFDRYHIVSPGDLQDVARRLMGQVTGKVASATVDGHSVSS